MSVAKINLFSKTINMRVDVTVILPEYPKQREAGSNYKEKYPSDFKFPVVYFLNGLTGDYTDGLTMMPMERYASEVGVAVVIPSGLNLWYEDIPGGPHMKTFIGEELPAAMEAIFPLADTTDKRFIAGLSMGGRGAAVLSATYYEAYRATVCLSAPLELSYMLKDMEIPGKELVEQSLSRAVGGIKNIDAQEYNYYSIVEHMLNQNQMIPEMLYLFGREDPLYKSQYQRFAKFVKKHKLPVDCEVWEKSGHDFGFWDPAMRKAMTWIAAKISVL